MAAYLEPLARLINALSKLPGIGQRSAARLAYHILQQPEPEVRELAEAIYKARRDIGTCPICGDYTVGDQPCGMCQDPRRDGSVLCVVRDPRDVAAMERSGAFRGRYHVLHGTISPSENRGPGDIRIKELLVRLRDGEVKELILATNPDLEGEATAMYLARLVKPLGIKVTRIAQGVQAGADLEYADDVTLSRALEGRRDM
ncbi:MAG: recombination mediator RecR [Eubacteriales bacterium]|nr:recombination mediator RecR [Eubacteriales bacterium]